MDHPDQIQPTQQPQPANSTEVDSAPKVSTQPSPEQKAKEFLKSVSRPKIHRYLLVFLGLIGLVLIVGTYYFKDYFLKQEEGGETQPASQSTQPVQPVSQATEYGFLIPEEKPREVKRYFEGLDYYEEIDGIKKLLVTEGTVEKIDQDSKIVLLQRGDLRANIQYQDSDLIYDVDYEERSQRQMKFSELKVGDHVSYSQADEEIGQVQNVWSIQR